MTFRCPSPRAGIHPPSRLLGGEGTRSQVEQAPWPRVHPLAHSTGGDDGAPSPGS